MLIRDYYTVDSVEEYEGGASFRVSLDPSCEVYRGHFPSRAISPGVCSIRMVTECAEALLERQCAGTAEPLNNSEAAESPNRKKLRITEIHRCRFTKLITPTDTPHLTVRLNLSEHPSPAGGAVQKDSAGPNESARVDDGETRRGQSSRLKAEITDGQDVCLTLDCTLIEE